MRADPPDVGQLERAILRADRTALARAITLVESTRADHRKAAEELLDRLAGHAGRSIRIGLTGVPGAGKSTLIDRLGSMLTAAGHKVAVLAVDPTSERTGGAILGDKTRMARLSVDAKAFVRPSPTSGTLGGVAAKTRETMLLCEAAGFDVVMVETVGVGQSEIAVSSMVDVFLLLMLPGAGDEIQGIKKGILEVADIVAVNKADGEAAARAGGAAAEIRAALGILSPRSAVWTPPVAVVSGLTGDGLEALWETVEHFRSVHEAAGLFAERRAEQGVRWLWQLLDAGLRHVLLGAPGIRNVIRQAEADVRSGARAPSAVARAVLGRITDR